jgi:hypothetical protein
MCSQEEILHGTRAVNGLDGGWGEILGFPVVAGDAGLNFKYGGPSPKLFFLYVCEMKGGLQCSKKLHRCQMSSF